MKSGTQAAQDLTRVGSRAEGVQTAEVINWLRRQPGLRRSPRSKGRLSTGLAALDALIGGGLPQSAISELVGPGTSGRTALSLAVVAAASQRGEVVAWIDPADALDPLSVRAAGVCLERLLWIRPVGRDVLKQSLQAADLVLDAGGFTVLVLDLAGTRARAMMQRPAWWIRLTRRLESTRTVLLTLSAHGVTGSAAALRLMCRRVGKSYDIDVKVLRMRGGPPGGHTAPAESYRPSIADFLSRTVDDFPVKSFDTVVQR